MFFGWNTGFQKYAFCTGCEHFYKVYFMFPIKRGILLSPVAESILSSSHTLTCQTSCIFLLEHGQPVSLELFLLCEEHLVRCRSSSGGRVVLTVLPVGDGDSSVMGARLKSVIKPSEHNTGCLTSKWLSSKLHQFDWVCSSLVLCGAQANPSEPCVRPPLTCRKEESRPERVIQYGPV